MQQMKKFILPIMAASVIGAATPVAAADYIVRPTAPRATMVVPAGPLTLQDALAIAANIGVVTVKDTISTIMNGRSKAATAMANGSRSISMRGPVKFATWIAPSSDQATNDSNVAAG